MGRPARGLRDFARSRGHHRQALQADHPGQERTLPPDLVPLACKQPLASSIAELQEQVDAFDVIYNTERPHQGLPGRITPQQAWDATPVAEPPRPKPADSVITAPAGVRGQGSREVKVQPYGYVYLHGIKFQTAKQRAGQTIHAVWDETGVVFADANGEILIERGWPPKGQTYVSNGIRRGRPSK